MEVYCLAALCFEVRLEALDLLADDFLHAGLGDMTYMTYNPKDDDINHFVHKDNIHSCFIFNLLQCQLFQCKLI